MKIDDDQGEADLDEAQKGGVPLTGIKFFNIDSVAIHEYTPSPDGEGPYTQVHVWLRFNHTPMPMVMRFKSRKGLSQFIEDLRQSRDKVWPKE